MGGSSNQNSFIPKRGPANRSRRTGSRQVYLFTLFSYVLFSATLVAAVGVFLYERYVDNQLENEVAALNTEIEVFREADLKSVREFNNRLTYTSERIAVATSLSTFFNALEAATAETVKITDLEIAREGDERYNIAAQIETDNFDSSLLQREFLEDDNVFATVVIDEIDVVTAAGNSDEAVASDSVSFTAALTVGIDSVAFIPPNTPVTNNNAVNTAPVESVSTTTLETETEASTDTDSLPDSNSTAIWFQVAYLHRLG